MFTAAESVLNLINVYNIDNEFFSKKSFSHIKNDLLSATFRLEVREVLGPKGGGPLRGPAVVTTRLPALESEKQDVLG